MLAKSIYSDASSYFVMAAKFYLSKTTIFVSTYTNVGVCLER